MIFRKASTIANLSRNRILLKMVLFFSHKMHILTKINKKKYVQPYMPALLVHSSIILTFVVMKFQIQTKLAGLWSSDYLKTPFRHVLLSLVRLEYMLSGVRRIISLMTKILLRIFHRSITVSVLTTTVNIVLPVVKKKEILHDFVDFGNLVGLFRKKYLTMTEIGGE